MSLRLLLAAFLVALVAVAGAKPLDRGPAVDPAKDYYAVLYTNRGEIPLVLFADKAPITVANFVNLAEGTGEFRDPRDGKTAKRPYYNGIQFHRVIPDFMIQCGDATGTGAGDPGYTIPDEFVEGLSFSKPGLLAMANRGANTGSTQWFITSKPTTWLDKRHTIFGEIVEGTSGEAVSKAIAAAPRDQKDKPISPIVLERVAIFRFDKGTKREDALSKMGVKSAAPAPTAELEVPAATTEEKK